MKLPIYQKQTLLEAHTWWGFDSNLGRIAVVLRFGFCHKVGGKWNEGRAALHCFSAALKFQRCDTESSWKLNAFSFMCQCVDDCWRAESTEQEHRIQYEKEIERMQSKCIEFTVLNPFDIFWSHIWIYLISVQENHSRAIGHWLGGSFANAEEAGDVQCRVVIAKREKTEKSLKCWNGRRRSVIWSDRPIQCKCERCERVYVLICWFVPCEWPQNQHTEAYCIIIFIHIPIIPSYLHCLCCARHVRWSWYSVPMTPWV